MVERGLGNANFRIVKELTAEGEQLDGLDSSELSIKLGWFPSILQIYEIKLNASNEIKVSKGFDFINISDLPKVKGGIHPVMYQIIRDYFKNKSVAKELYRLGEETIEKVLAKKESYEEIKRFDRKRRRII